MNARDYIGQHVTWTASERKYLATVTNIYYRSDGALILKTRHFCGDDAPNVAAADVEVLKREWPQDGDS